MNACPQHDELYKLVSDIHTKLVGTDEKPGVFERLRELERVKRTITGVVVAILGLIGNLVYTWINQAVTK